MSIVQSIQSLIVLHRALTQSITEPLLNLILKVLILNYSELTSDLTFILFVTGHTRVSVTFLVAAVGYVKPYLATTSFTKLDGELIPKL